MTPDDDRTAAQPDPPPPAGDEPRFGPPARPGDLGTLGRYHVRRLLGKGGMGAVYLARDPRLARDVALKVMLPAAAADPKAKDRFLREARSAARISHDHVIGILDADETDGTPYIALPFLKGYPLDEYLKKKGRPPVAQSVRVAREMADGLAAAHALGIVHRDIKPGNVWLEAPHGRVKLLDFGLAKPTAGGDEEERTDLTRTGAVVGTPAYMAPEQAASLPVDHRADLFALGCVLYRLLCDRPPFARPTVMATLTALAIEAPVPVSEVNPEVPPALAQLVEELLSKNPDHRPVSAAAVSDRLRAIEQGAGPEAVTVMPGAAVPVAVPADLSVTGASVFAQLVEETTEPDRPAVKAGGKGLLALAAAGGLLAAMLAVGAALKLTRPEPPPEAKGPDERRKAEPKPPPPKPPAKTPLVDPAKLPPLPPEAPRGSFDELDPANIPADERVPWLPKETVAVIGSHRGAVLTPNFYWPPTLSPDGRWFTGPLSGAGNVLYDAATLKARHYGPSAGAHLFTPDGKWWATCKAGDAVEFRDLSQQAVPVVFRLPARDRSGIDAILVRPDGKGYVTGTRAGGIYLWDDAGKPAGVVRPARDHHREAVNRLAVTPDGGRLLASVWDDEEKVYTVRVYDLSADPPANGQTIRSKEYMRFAVLGDGRRVLVAPYTRVSAHRVAVFDLSGPEPKLAAQADAPGYPHILGVTPDGREVSLRFDAADGTAPCVVWATDTLTKLRDLPPDLYAVTPDRSRMLQIDPVTRRYRVLDAAGQPVAKPDAAVVTKAYVPAAVGDVVYTWADQSVWTVTNGRFARTPLPADTFAPPRQLGDFFRDVFTAGGSLAGIPSNEGLVYARPAGRPPVTLQINPNGPFEPFRTLAWQADGKRLFTLTTAGALDEWDVTAAPPPRTRVPLPDPVRGDLLVISPNGRLAAVGTNPVSLIDLREPKPAVHELSVSELPTGLAFSVDGRHLHVCHMSGRFGRFDLTRSDPEWELLQDGGIGRLYPSPDGRRLAGVNANGITVIDPIAGTNKGILWPDQTGYGGVRWTPDGRHLLVPQFGCVYVLRVK